MPTPNSSQELEYIYQHFQENEKVYESDPKLATDEVDSTLYPHINNDIEYGLFEDVIIYPIPYDYWQRYCICQTI